MTKLPSTWTCPFVEQDKISFTDTAMSGIVEITSGTETGNAGQQTIAHGCAFTPTKAQVCVTNIDDGANPYLSAEPDATNIYVTAVNLKVYRWEVKR